MLLRHYLEHGMSKSAVARHVGVSRDTVHRWLRDGALDRFVLGAPGVTSTIGMHVSGSGTFFGAVVRLSDLADFPDSLHLSTPDVLGSVVMAFPAVSADVLRPLVLNVSAGTYALVFGSFLFGANGVGGAPTDGADIGTPSYFYKIGSYGDGGFTRVRMSIS